MIAWCAFFLALGLTASASPLLPEPAFSSVSRGSRIISGWEAQEGQFPYQLSLRLVNTAGSMHACGASLIHAEWALTAAHCTAERIRVIVSGGSNSFARPEFQVETTEYYTHPSYLDHLAGMVQPDDISLIKFASVTFNDRVQPIRIASSADKDKDLTGVRLVASGWGSTTTGGLVPDILNWVYLRGISNSDCLAAYGFNPLVQDSTLCTIGYNDISQSTCHGDNGSPLVSFEDGTLVGISSFMANLGCHVGIPAGFVRANYYLDWYTEVTGIDFEAEEATTVAPEEETTEAPEEEVTEAPEEEVTEAPEEEVTEAPEEEVTEAPEEEVTEAPEEEVTEAPEEEVTEAPEEEVTEAPEEEVTEAPEEEVTEAPEEEVTEAPEEEVTEAPEEEVTEAPEEETTEAPEEEVTEAPEEEVTEAPEEEVTEAPEEEVTEAPEEEVTEAPEEEVTEAPEEEVTEAPEEEVTEAPEEETTEAPEEDDSSSSESSESSSEESAEVETTKAPEEEATEAPEEEVTEAPEKEEDSSSESSSEESLEVETTKAPEAEATEAPEEEKEEESKVIDKMRRFFRFRA